MVWVFFDQNKCQGMAGANTVQLGIFWGIGAKHSDRKSMVLAINCRPNALPLSF